MIVFSLSQVNVSSKSTCFIKVFRCRQQYFGKLQRNKNIFTFFFLIVESIIIILVISFSSKFVPKENILHLLKCGNYCWSQSLDSQFFFFSNTVIHCGNTWMRETKVTSMNTDFLRVKFCDGTFCVRIRQLVLCFGLEFFFSFSFSEIFRVMFSYLSSARIQII